VASSELSCTACIFPKPCYISILLAFNGQAHTFLLRIWKLCFLITTSELVHAGDLYRYRPSYMTPIFQSVDQPFANSFSLQIPVLKPSSVLLRLD
jgi:hypothetical protein